MCLGTFVAGTMKILDEFESEREDETDRLKSDLGTSNCQPEASQDPGKPTPARPACVWLNTARPFERPAGRRLTSEDRGSAKHFCTGSSIGWPIANSLGKMICDQRILQVRCHW